MQIRLGQKVSTNCPQIFTDSVNRSKQIPERRKTEELTLGVGFDQARTQKPRQGRFHLLLACT